MVVWRTLEHMVEVHDKCLYGDFMVEVEKLFYGD